MPHDSDEPPITEARADDEISSRAAELQLTGDDRLPDTHAGHPVARYYVALSPHEVLDALTRREDVHVRNAGNGRDLADVITKRAFVATTGGQHAFSVYATRPNAIAGIGAGFMGRLHMHVELAPSDEGTHVVCRFVNQRSVQSRLRWSGLLATTAVGLAWVLVGGGDLVQRALLLAAFSAFTLPVLAYDLSRYRGSAHERVALLNLAERMLGPAVIGATPQQKTPFRRGHLLPSVPSED